MKPDWEHAPDFAKWLAMDADGWWYWYENLPRQGSEYWLSKGGLVERAGVTPDVWVYSLEERP